MTIGDLVALTKLRVNALVVATAASGYYMGGPQPFDWTTVLQTCAGTLLVASGAAAFNQVTERGTDRLMQRTANRPVASGRLGAGPAQAIAWLLSLPGLALITAGASAPAAVVAAVTLVTYAAVYTPLKRRTSLSTVVGAVPGALPPLIGWAAAGASLAAPAPWALFTLMFLWQLPHFLAIAWMYRDDYARAGLPMLPVIDPAGALTGRQAILWATIIVPVSQAPFLLGLTGAVYPIAALVLGVGQLALAARFALQPTARTARALFYGSITYLPMLWAVMAADRRT
jgi:protoheme IX farnesyltransferase